MPRETGARSRWRSETALSARLGTKRLHPSSHVLVGDTASFLFSIRHCYRTFMRPGLATKTWASSRQLACTKAATISESSGEEQGPHGASPSHPQSAPTDRCCDSFIETIWCRFSWRWAWWSSVPHPVFGADTFTRGSVFWAPGDCSGACEVFDVTGGGDLGSFAGFATVDRSPGQIAWSQDLGSAYISEFFQNRVSKISATGAVSLFFSGIINPTGLLRTADNRLLAASFNHGAVYDISGGDESPPLSLTALYDRGGVCVSTDSGSFVNYPG